MKNICILLLLFCSSLAFAQIPQLMNYQTVLRDAQGNLLRDSTVTVKFTISINSSPVYIETHVVTTNQFGLFTTVIGSGTIEYGNFGGIAWTSGNTYLQVELDVTNSGNFVNMGQSQLVSVPYALFAQSAFSAGGSLYLGQLYGGGVIYDLYTDSTGQQHGLIVALNDQAANVVWSDTDAAIGVSAESSWNGAGNTNAIVASGESNTAAQFCKNYSGGGFNDWYLPSIDELTALYNNRFKVNRTLSTAGTEIGLDAIYWSSTEDNLQGSIAWGYTTGGIYFQEKSGWQYNVRAIRAF